MTSLRRASRPLAIFRIGAAATGILALALAALPGTASAQANRTFVSAQNGLDTNPCTVAQPCRSFQQAESVTNSGGEILALDSGGYGVLSITKSITVNAPKGIEAAITTSTSGDAITIGATGGVVNLRGLTLVGGGIGANGITFAAGAVLNIEDCVVAGFLNNGLNFLPGAVSTVTVTDTIVSDNAAIGVYFAPSAGATASFKRVQALRNGTIGFGVAGNNAPASAAVTATATDSIAANNVHTGLLAESSEPGSSAEATTFLIVNSTSIDNDEGVRISAASATTTAILAETTISGNTVGFDTGRGAIETFGNNFLTDNGANNGTLTPIAPE